MKETEISIDPNHPHGPPDPRWITEDGRCLLCSHGYHLELMERCKNSVAVACTEFPNVHAYIKQLEEDVKLLQWLENNSDKISLQCDLAAVNPFWFNKWNQKARCMVVFAQGKDLRSAIKSAIESKLLAVKG